MLPSGVRAPLDRHPLAREAVVVVLLFGGFLLWIEVLRPVGYLAAAAVDPLVTVDASASALVESALVTSGIIAAGMVAFTVVYARARDLSLSVDIPNRGNLPPLAAAMLLPAVAVAAVYGFARATGTTLAALTDTYVAADTSVAFTVIVTVLDLLIGLPAYVCLAHALVQRTLRTATGAWSAIGLTTVLVGLTGPTELAGPGLSARIAAVSLLLAAAIALPAYAAHAFDDAWLPWVCAVPLALFATGFVVEWLTGFEGPAAVALGLAEVAVVALGGYAYERTDTLLAPALAYASFVVTTKTLIILFETGVRP